MPKLCGAKTRAGGTCQQPGNPKNGRCRYHGGSSTGPKNQRGNTNRLTHGFYSNALTVDELALYRDAPVGGVDDEIRLLRVKLHRLVRLSGTQDVADLVDAAITVAQKQDTHPEIGKFDKSEIKVKAAQYGDLICQCIDRIVKLELARKELLKADAERPEQPDNRPIGRIVVEVVGARAASDHDGTAGAVLPARG